MKGTFEVKVKQSLVREIGAKNTPAVSLELEIVKEMPSGDTEFAGKSLYWDGFLSDAAFDNTVKRLEEVFGYTGSDLADFTKGIVDGKGAQVVVEEVYNAEKKKTYSQVR